MNAWVCLLLPHEHGVFPESALKTGRVSGRFYCPACVKEGRDGMVIPATSKQARLAGLAEGNAK